MSIDKVDASLELLRRLDPRSVSTNLNSICTILAANSNSEDDEGESAELIEELLSAVDVPLKVAHCTESGKDYLCCDYNRDGDSYRSPWSNQYFPEPEEDDLESPPPYPSKILRQLELKANDAFDIYRDLYYEGAGISSVYFWDTAYDDDDEEEDEKQGNNASRDHGLEDGFAGVVLFKKETSDGSGKWDSIHVLEVIPESLRRVNYKLTTSVILDLKNSNQNIASKSGKNGKGLSLSGSITRQLEQSQVIDLDSGVNLETNHLINIGTLVEKAEYNIRNALQEVYFDKLKDIMLKDLRSLDGASEREIKGSQSDIIKGLQSL